MKSKNVFNRHFHIMSLSVVTIYLCFMVGFCSGQEFNKNVMQAYKLRISGQADSTKVILEQILSKDSTIAAAWYELARTKHHIGLGNPRELVSSMSAIQQAVQNAVDIDPNNVIYQYYKGYTDFFNLYISLKMNKKNVNENFAKVVKSYKTVLDLKPDYHQAKLFLVELYGNLPQNLGGDSAKAEKYIRELEEADVVCGAKAKEIVLPEDANRVEFWQKVKKSQISDANVHETLGKAYLQTGNDEEAIKCFENAINLNSVKNFLYLDLGKYYMMQAMRNPESVDSLSKLINNTYETYLNSQPEPINPLKAFAVGKLAMIKFKTGDKESGIKLQKEALSFDPYYSKAFGTPSQILFDPPDRIIYVHEYFFRLF